MEIMLFIAVQLWPEITQNNDILFLFAHYSNYYALLLIINSQINAYIEVHSSGHHSEKPP